MTFMVSPTLDGGFLVEGTDSKGNDGAQVLYSESWNEVLAKRAHAQAQAVFDAAAEEHFKPLIEAAEAARKIVEGDTGNLRVYTIAKGIDGVPDEEVVLDRSGVILRLLDESKHTWLRWVGGELVGTRV